MHSFDSMYSPTMQEFFERPGLEAVSSRPSKEQNDKRGFGTIKDFYQQDAQWLAHSMRPVQTDPKNLRVWVGGADCKQPYSMSVFNISAMSFGSGGSSKSKAWRDIWGCGQGLGAIKGVVPAVDVVARLRREYAAAVARLAKQAQA